MRLPPKPARKPLERDVLSDVRAALAAMPDVIVHRNVNSMAFAKDGTPLRVGLGDGSADLIGSLTLRVYATPFDSVGRLVARSFAIELKRAPGIKAAPHQAAWLEAHRKAGWIVGVVGNVDEAVALIERARRWEI